MFKYQTLHRRKIIRKLSSKEKYDFSKKALLGKARKLYNEMVKKEIVKESAKRIGYLACRIDLAGAPEVSFTIAVEKGKMQFIPSGGTDEDMAIGMSKEFFVDLVNDPPKYGNMKILLFNNLYLRKGRAQLFRYLKPLLVNALLATK